MNLILKNFTDNTSEALKSIELQVNYVKQKKIL